MYFKSNVYIGCNLQLLRRMPSHKLWFKITHFSRRHDFDHNMGRLEINYNCLIQSSCVVCPDLEAAKGFVGERRLVKIYSDDKDGNRLLEIGLVTSASNTFQVIGITCEGNKIGLVSFLYFQFLVLKWRKR